MARLVRPSVPGLTVGPDRAAWPAGIHKCPPRFRDRPNGILASVALDHLRYASCEAGGFVKFGRGAKLRLIVVVCIGLSLAGCGRVQERITQPPPLCRSGTPSPISVRALMRRFAAHGIVMRPFRMLRCPDPQTVAEIWNHLGVSVAQQRVVTLRQGAIHCRLYEASRAETLERLTFAHGRSLVVFTLKNVSCTVYPSSQLYLGSPDRHRQQERAVERVMQTLSG